MKIETGDRRRTFNFSHFSFFRVKRKDTKKVSQEVDNRQAGMQTGRQQTDTNAPTWEQTRASHKPGRESPAKA